jgi:putative component of membrane protein insertase Oxa1/YidC/SpoIIIJ protein YidD
MRIMFLAAIRLYQAYISPHKGFCCAYRKHTGRASCSALGYRSVRRYGTVGGLIILRKRTRLCGIAHWRYSPAVYRPFASQRGECDPGCDWPGSVDCDLPGGQTISRLLELGDCCDIGSCDWGDRRQRRQESGNKRARPPLRNRTK